jgi:light-regulated signal transduction histidine kinase (bacteriophytochrome)
MSVAERDPRADRSNETSVPVLQPFAALIAVTTDWEISHVSANIDAFLGLDASILGHTLDQVFLDEAVHEIRGVLNATAGQDGVGRLYGCALRLGFPAFDLTVHDRGDRFILEFECGEAPTRVDDIGLVRGLISRVRQSNSPKEAAHKAARSLRALTGFDRVSLCASRGQGAEVLAEASMPGMETLSDVDIDKYIKSLSAISHPFMVADIDAELVSIISRPGVSLLDTGFAISAAPDPVIKDALRASNVKASLSMPIIRHGETMGWVICHHSRPLCAGFRMRVLADLFVELYAYTLSEN